MPAQPRQDAAAIAAIEGYIAVNRCTGSTSCIRRWARRPEGRQIGPETFEQALLKTHP
jgi:hypothetical protein